jgi:hypothetical protein
VTFIGPSVDAQWQILIQLLNIGAVLLAVHLTVKATVRAEAVKISKTIAPLARIEIARIRDALIETLETETDPIEVKGISINRDGAAFFIEHGSSLGALPTSQAEAALKFYATFFATHATVMHDGGTITSSVGLNDAKILKACADEALESLKGTA